MPTVEQRLRVAARPLVGALRRAARRIGLLVRPPVPWDGRHHAAVARIEPWRGESDGTWAHDFLGVRTDIRFRPQFRPDPPGPVAPAPPPPHAAYFELVAVLEAVAEAPTGRPFTMLEAGAGYGHWLGIARRALSRSGRREPARLIGIELVPRHHAFLLEHLRTNGEPGDDVVAINAAVGASDGEVEFVPEPDPAHAYGQSVSRRSADATSPGAVRVPRVRLARIVDAEPRIDVVHVDVQGAERDAIPDALPALTRRARRLVLATHSGAIHRRLRRVLSEGGWTLDHDFRPGRRERTEFGDVRFLDGLLTARNPSLAD